MVYSLLALIAVWFPLAIAIVTTMLWDYWLTFSLRAELELIPSAGRDRSGCCFRLSQPMSRLALVPPTRARRSSPRIDQWTRAARPRVAGLARSSPAAADDDP